MPLICPICSTNVPLDQTICPRCQSDLSGYQSVYYAPEALYNEAVALVQEGEYHAAYDKLAAAHFLRPLDTEIIQAMSHCAEQAGDFLNAMEKMALILVESSDPAAADEYARLDALRSEKEKKDAFDKEQTQKVYAEIKALIAQATQEAVMGLVLSIAQNANSAPDQ